jgi:hypothetical protein
LVRNRHERGADVRRRALEAAESFVLKADDWDTAVREAIESRFEHLYDTDGSEPAVTRAKEALREARRELNRLHMLMPPYSHAAELAAVFVRWLQLALEEVETWPPDSGKSIASPVIDHDVADEDDAELQAAYADFEESYQEAEMLRVYGLKTFGKFSRAASAELRSGFSPAFKRAAFVTPRRVLKRLRAPLERRREARLRAGTEEWSRQSSRAFRERAAQSETSDSARSL